MAFLAILGLVFIPVFAFAYLLGYINVKLDTEMYPIIIVAAIEIIGGIIYLIVSKSHSRKAKWAIFSAFAFSFLCIASPKIIYEIIDHHRYNVALSLYQAGKYEDASEYLHMYIGNNDHGKLYGLYCYSESHIYDMNDNLEGAYGNIAEANRYGFILSEDSEYADRVSAEYKEQRKAEAKKQEEAAQRKKELEKEQYAYKVRYGIPFVGMREADIDKTTLGAHKGEWITSNIINGEMVNGISYLFLDRNKDIIFLAHCQYGRVDDIIDYRKNPWHRPINWYSDSSSLTKKDPYHAKDYTDAEDFYDEYYDDFLDYEDAETYWEEQNGIY